MTLASEQRSGAVWMMGNRFFRRKHDKLWTETIQKYREDVVNSRLRLTNVSSSLLFYGYFNKQAAVRGADRGGRRGQT